MVRTQDVVASGYAPPLSKNGPENAVDGNETTVWMSQCCPATCRRPGRAKRGSLETTGIDGDFISHDGSMVLLYMVLHGSHQYTPFKLALIYQHHGSVMGFDFMGI